MVAVVVSMFPGQSPSNLLPLRWRWRRDLSVVADRIAKGFGGWRRATSWPRESLT